MRFSQVAEQPTKTVKLDFSREIEKNQNLLPDGTDLDKLSWAVAMHETKNCEIKTNFTIHNNCHGFRWNGNIYKFKTQQASHDYFKDLWTRKYGKFPDINLAKKYSGGDRSATWLKNVTYFYNNN